MRIIDSLLVPFEIVADTDQYTVVKKTIGKESGKENEQTIGYYISLPNALKRIAKEQVLSGSKDTTTLKEFVKALETKEGVLAQSIKF